MEWLEESEKSLDSELEIANDPDKIKTQLAQHKVGLQLRKACMSFCISRSLLNSYLVVYSSLGEERLSNMDLH